MLCLHCFLAKEYSDCLGFFGTFMMKTQNHLVNQCFEERTDAITLNNCSVDDFTLLTI